MSIERVVVILTPAFAAASGWVVSSVAQLAPGVNLNKGDVTALFAAGVVTAFGAVHKWLGGRQKFTEAVSDADQLADRVVARINANPQAGPALADIDGLLKSHTDQIVSAISGAVHAPPSVEEVVAQMARELAQKSAPAAESVQASTALPIQ